MVKYGIIKNGMDDAEREYYQRFYKSHKVTNDLLEIRETADNGNSGVYVRKIIVEGSWTPSGCARYCGDHLVYAAYDRYIRLNVLPGTPVITKCISDVEDM